MSRASLLWAVPLLLCGCNMYGHTPLPARLSDEEQQRYEESWAHLVALGPAVDRAALLDALLLAQAWHRGVDDLYLRTEKRIGTLRIVMESHFDRLRPDEDVFVVSFLDARGRLLREDAFARADIDEAIALYVTWPDEIEGESDEAYERRMARLAERDARLRRALEVFPLSMEEDDPDDADFEFDEALDDQVE